jgi:type II secretory pathway component PulJ
MMVAGALLAATAALGGIWLGQVQPAQGQTTAREQRLFEMERRRTDALERMARAAERQTTAMENVVRRLERLERSR